MEVLELPLKVCEIKGRLFLCEGCLLLLLSLYGFRELILSLESTVFEKKDGGDWDPHLSKLEELDELLLLLGRGVETFFGKYVILAKVL